MISVKLKLCNERKRNGGRRKYISGAANEDEVKNRCGRILRGILIASYRSVLTPHIVSEGCGSL